MYPLFVVDFWKYGLLQEETNSIFFNQRRQIGWSKKSVYTLKLLPKIGNRYSKCHAFQVYLVVENVETLDFGLCLSICVCVWGGGSRVALRVRFAVRSGNTIVSVYDTHESEPLGPNWYISLTVGLTTRDATDTLASCRHNYRISRYIRVQQEWRNFVYFLQKNVQSGGQWKGSSCVPRAVDSHSLRPQSSVLNSNRTAGAIRRNPECWGGGWCTSLSFSVSVVCSQRCWLS